MDGKILTILFLEQVETQEEADERERYYIRLYDSITNGYNIALGGYTSDSTQRKRVYLYNSEATLFCEYESLSAAAEDLGDYVTNISKSCSTPSKAVRGYYCSYTPLTTQQVQERVRANQEQRLVGQKAMAASCCKPVIEVDLATGEILHEWPSGTAASKETGINPNRISQDCKKTKVTGSFKRSTIFQFRDNNNFRKD